MPGWSAVDGDATGWPKVGFGFVGEAACEGGVGLVFGDAAA
jgi:hypothetical protein